MNVSKEDYSRIYKHYESILEKYGPNSRGMDWPKDEDVIKRYLVMSQVGQFENSEQTPHSMLDLGCGIGLLSEFLYQEFPSKYTYHGVDISDKMISTGKNLYPNVSLECRDILVNPFGKDQFDFVVMNGLLTEKVDLKKDKMIAFAEKIIRSAFDSARIGVAFNTMSSHVDWERDDLFHWKLDEMVGFLVKECSRNIQVRMDYGLYEYTVYVYKKPVV